MIPIETMNITYHVVPAGVQSPSWVLLFARWMGISIITIDGQIQPGTLLVMMFAVWGIWHWILMIRESVGAMPRLIERFKGVKK
jgi:hypothetical protein